MKSWKVTEEVWLSSENEVQNKWDLHERTTSGYFFLGVKRRQILFSSVVFISFYRWRLNVIKWGSHCFIQIKQPKIYLHQNKNHPKSFFFPLGFYLCFPLFCCNWCLTAVFCASPFLPNSSLLQIIPRTWLRIWDIAEAQLSFEICTGHV